MHPAYSVIFFTVSSGAGYGLMIWLGLLGALGRLPADRWFGFTGFALALTAVTAGLLTSSLHLGRPERAWRAFSQWRTSWLSREGVLAVATYLPAAILACGWVFWQQILSGIGVWLAVSALITLFCTSMIYASLKTIRRWRHPMTPIGYVMLGLGSGALWLTLLTHLFGQSPAIDFIGLMLMLAGAATKILYWRSIDTETGGPDMGTATGLGRFGKVRLFASPHTSENYLLKEMGYHVARKHALKLRRIALLSGFLAPAVLIALAALSPGWLAIVFIALAVALNILGILTERWLFFAEARHTVTLYYGADAA
jgi:DMSO reductase anchor subunit